MPVTLDQTLAAEVARLQTLVADQTRTLAGTQAALTAALRIQRASTTRVWTPADVQDLYALLGPS